MNLLATVVDPLVQPRPDGWDEFVSGQRLLPAWDWQLLRLAGWCARYPSSMVLVRDSGSGTTVAAFHARHLGPSRSGRFARPGRVPPVNLTECRAVPGLGPGVAFAGGLSRPDRAEAVRVFERAIQQRAGAGGRAIAYRHLGSDQLAAVPAAGRVRVRASPTMVVENRWPDLVSYLASRSRNLRGLLRKTRHKLERDRTIVIGQSTTIEPAEACWLVHAVARRYGSRPTPPCPAGYFARLGELPGSRFLTYRADNGRLLAFVAMYDDGVDLYSGLWGSRDQADGGQRNLYFDVHRRQVEWLIGAGRRRLLLGSGMPEIKARFGARTEARWALLGLR